MVTTHMTINQSQDHERMVSPVVIQAFEELSAEPDRLGVSFELLPLSTAEAINEIIPSPPSPMRVRRREERSYKPYVKACGSNFLQSCLSLAIHPDNLALHITALQPELPFYETPEGREFAALAIVAMKGIADLAKKAGMSYAQTQQTILLLVTLGFMKRMRFGRRFIYAVPLMPYNPSPDEIHRQLEALLSDLDLAERSPSTAAKEKRSRFRKTVEMVKLRYEVRYGLSPDPNFSAELLRDSERVEALREIRAALPPQARAVAMPEITRIVVTQLVGKKSWGLVYDIHSTTTLNQGTKVDHRTAIDSFPVNQESTLFHLSNEQDKEGRVEQPTFPFDEVTPLTPGAKDRDRDIQEEPSRLLDEKDLNGESDEDDPLKLLEAAGADDLMASDRTQVPKQHLNSFDGDASLKEGEYRCEIDKVLLAEQADILALILEEDWREIDVGGEKQRVSWVDVNKEGKTVRMSCADPDVKLMKAGCHRAILSKTDPTIAKAAFVYSLWWGRLGKIKKARPAYFKSICERWMREHSRSYEEACKANTRSRGTRVISGGIGVPRQVRKIMSLFGHCSYEELALIIRRCSDEELMLLTEKGIPPMFAWSSSSLAAVDGIVSDRDKWLMSLQQLGKKRDQSDSRMSQQDANALLERIAVEMPSVSRADMRRESDHTFSVLVSLRSGASWEIHSMQEWDSYQEKLLRIKQLKDKLKQGVAIR